MAEKKKLAKKKKDLPSPSSWSERWDKREKEFEQTKQEGRSWSQNQWGFKLGRQQNKRLRNSVILIVFLAVVIAIFRLLVLR